MSRKVKISVSVVSVLAVMVIISSYIFLPDPLFSDSCSTVIYDRNGQLLDARVASDEQWRFPVSDTIPDKFKIAITLREDQYFYVHPGFNPVSMFDALLDNLKAGRVVRGGSTITMQTIRLSRKGKSRTVYEKLIELYLAIGLEMNQSKSDILKLYCSYAPFGGNVVGLEAACWRYFGHEPSQLSWGEAATLAVLPNAPSLIHPGKNREVLKRKRDDLLRKIYSEGEIDSLTLVISLMERLPDKPISIPHLAPHLLSKYLKTRSGTRTKTTLDRNLQQTVSQIVEIHHKRLAKNEIHNAAVLILKPETYEVLAYIGNTKNTDGKSHGNAVDLIHAKRSTGSILKPLLYAAMIEDGMIMPDALIPDIPSYYENYHPQNYDLTFEGAVPASQALSRSRNVPAVYMLRDYGGAPFLRLLTEVGLNSFNRSADHYGLTLILGGGEASLWGLSNMYAGMVRTMLNYERFDGRYSGTEYDPPIIELNKVERKITSDFNTGIPIHAASVWLTHQALHKVIRPDEEEGWEQFNSSMNIAWKTGTSYGFRDGWAIGSTADFVVGVWVGNADGEGREGLTGTQVAAPIMFEVFNQLNLTTEIYPPFDELMQFSVCRNSGFRASRYCPDIDTIWSYHKGGNTNQCKYHQLVFLDKEENYRLTQECASISEMVPVSWFVLPPVQEWYYRKGHPTYRSLPEYAEGCVSDDTSDELAFIYPTPSEKVFVPMGLDQSQQEVVFEVSHRHPGEKVYWHIDQVYLGETVTDHQFGFVPEKGWHTLTVVDESGESNSIQFEVVNGKVGD